MPRKAPLLVVFAVLVATVSLVSNAGAQLSDPATLFLGPINSIPSNTTPTKTAYAFGGEVHLVTTLLDIYQNSGGAPTLSNPVLLIIATPVCPTCSSALSSSSVGSPATLVSKTNSILGTPSLTFASNPYGNTTGSLAANSSTDIYAALGIGSAVPNAAKGTNMNQWDAAVAGFDTNSLNTISSFNLWTFAINTSQFCAKCALDLTLNNVPAGSFLVAYGASSSKLWGTPFTQTALVFKPPPPQVPEPASLSLLGAGLLGMAWLCRRKLTRP